MDRQNWQSGLPLSARANFKRDRLWRSVVGVVGTGAITLVASPGWANPLTRWQYDPQTNNLEVTVKDGTEPRYFLMAQPARIIVDLPETSIGEVTKQATYNGAIRQIRLAQHNKNTTRIVLELAPNAVLAPGQVQLQRVDGAKSGSVRWVVRPLIAANPTTTANLGTANPGAIAPNPAINSTANESPKIIQPALVQPPQATDPPIANGVTSVEPAAPVSLAPVLTTPSLKPTNENAATATPPTETRETLPASLTPALSAAQPKPEVIPKLPTATKSEAGNALANPIAVPTMPSAPPSQRADQPVESVQPQPVVQPVAIAVPPPETATNSQVSSLPQVNPAKPALPTATQSEQLSSAVASRTSTTDGAIPPVKLPPVVNVTSEPLAIAAPGLTQSPTARVTTPLPEAAPTPTEATSLIEVPNTLPTFAQATSQPTVTVPPLDFNPANYPTPNPGEFPTPNPPSPSPNSPPEVTVPPLQPLDFPATISPPGVTVPALQPQGSPDRPAMSATGNVIDFGQPLPAAAQTQSFFVPKGTILSLRYPNSVATNLRTGTPQQEVLFLQSEVRDGRGYVIFPAGSAVTGRFETSTAGSRFITQAISVAGRSIPLVARSQAIAGGRRISENNLLRNAGIGAAAGAVLSDFSGYGVLGGAVAGAAVTYFTSPKPATIQPDQTIQVQLMEDLQRF